LSTIGSVAGKISVKVFDTNQQLHHVIRVNLTNYAQIGSVFVNETGAITWNGFYFDAGVVKYTTGAVDVLICQ
jgi:hypothetical protein